MLMLRHGFKDITENETQKPVASHSSNNDIWLAEYILAR